MVFSFNRLLVCAALGLFASSSPWAQNTPADTPDRAAQVAPADVSNPDPVRNSELSAELFYSILLAELNVQTAPEGGSIRDAYVLMLDAAQRSGDERLYERTVRLAIENRVGDAALQALRAWKRTHPLSERANGYHVQVLIGLNRIEESVELLRQELRRTSTPNRALIIERIPYGYAQVGDKKRASVLIERALAPYVQQRETAVVSWVSIARLRLQAGDASSALDAVRMAASLDVQAPSPIFLAAELIAPNQPMAQTLVDNYLSQNPSDADLRFFYARTLIGQDRANEARTQIEHVLRLRPDWAVPHLILGTLAAEQNAFPQATQSLQEYLKLSDALPEAEKQRGTVQAYLALSSVALKQNDFDRALYWLDRVDNPPDPLTLVVRRATIVAKQGQLDAALELIASTEDTTPEVKRRKVLAQTQLLREHQKFIRAYDLVAQARATGNTDPDLLFEQAMLAEKLARHDTMEELLREHIRVKPHDHAAYNALGYFLADHNLRLPQAKVLLEKALSLVPNDPFVTDSMGWLEFRLGNLDKARDLLEQAFQAKPDAEIAAHLGEVYWHQGALGNARDLWQRAQQIDAKNETLIETVKRLNTKAIIPSKLWRGRLALTVHSEPEQAWSAGFELQGNAQQGTLHVFSPLGAAVSTLKWSPEQAVLLAGDKTVAYPSLSDLTHAATGTALPIEALFEWLAGRTTAVPGWTVDLSRHAQGRISATRTQPEPRAELRVVLE